MDISIYLDKIVPITLFNKGQASKQFHRVYEEGALAVIKNNTPVAVIVSPEEYEALRSLSRICKKDLYNYAGPGSDGIIAAISKIDAIDKEGSD